MDERRFEEFVRAYKLERDGLRRIIAYIVITLGYEPQSWLETEAIALELSTKVRGKNNDA